MYAKLKINNIVHNGIDYSIGLNESFGNLYFFSFDKLIVTVQLTRNSPLQPKILGLILVFRGNISNITKAHAFERESITNYRNHQKILKSQKIA